MRLRGCLAILHKEIIHMVRDPATMLFAMLPPIVQVIAFGFAISTDVRNLPTIVHDQDVRRMSRELIDSFENTGVFKIERRVHSHEELMRLLVEGKAVAGIEIPPDYSSRRQKGEGVSIGVFIDGSNNTIALQAMSTANGIGFQSVKSPEARKLGPGAVEVRPRVLFNPDLLSANFFVPGIIGVAIQLSLTMLVAFAIVREREIGTLEQLMVSPATRLALLLGKVVPYVIFAFMEMGILMVVMRFVFGIRMQGSPWLLFSLSGLFALAVIGIGLLISALAKNQVQATQMAIATLLPSIFFSGFIYPRETMPLFFFMLSYLLPLTYFLDILRGIILRGAELGHLLRSVVPLSAMAAGLLSVSILKFRKRLD